VLRRAGRGIGPCKGTTAWACQLFFRRY